MLPRSLVASSHQWLGLLSYPRSSSMPRDPFNVLSEPAQHPPLNSSHHRWPGTSVTFSTRPWALESTSN